MVQASAPVTKTTSTNFCKGPAATKKNNKKECRNTKNFRSDNNIAYCDVLASFVYISIVFYVFGQLIKYGYERGPRGGRLNFGCVGRNSRKQETFQE